MEEGTVLRNNYQLERLLGRGGMAEVYLAFDMRRHTRVAVKILREDLAEDPEFVRRFTREAEALARLDHPHIVRFYSFERQGAVAFIVMDFVPGTTLQRHLAELGGPLPLGEVSTILHQVGAALQYAHSEGYIHRDIKPGNIMLRDDGNALLSDFGIARAAESATLMTATMGTPAYMAPEQILGRELDRRTDIYSFGIVLFEMLTGHRPFTGDERGITGTGTLARLREAHLRVQAPDPRSLNPALPPGLGDVVLRALAKDPAQRWPDVVSLIQAWDAVSGVPSPISARSGTIEDYRQATPARAPLTGAWGTTTGTPAATWQGSSATGAGSSGAAPSAWPAPAPDARPLSVAPGPGGATPPAGWTPATPVRKSKLPIALIAVGAAAGVVIIGLLLWQLLAAGPGRAGPSRAAVTPVASGVDIEKTAQALAVSYAQATQAALGSALATSPASTRLPGQTPEKTVQPAAGLGTGIITPSATAAATEKPTSTPSAPTQTSAPAATATPYVVVKNDGVNLRGGPGTVYSVVGTANKDTTFAIVARDQAAGWYRLAGSEERWVAASVVEASGQVPVAANIPATPAVSAASGSETSSNGLIAPILLEPVDGYTLWPLNTANFKFKWTGRPLAANEQFELRIWKEDVKDHMGAAEPIPYVADPSHVYSIYIGSIRSAPGVKSISTEDWINVYWTVAVVQVNPYRQTGPEAKRFWIRT